MSVQSPCIHSVGTLARLFGVPVSRIQYVIRSCNIQPAGIAGNVRLFDEAPQNGSAVNWNGSQRIGGIQ